MMTTPERQVHARKVETTIRKMDIDDLSAVFHLGDRLFTSEEFPILYRTWDAFEVTQHFTSDAEYCLVAEMETGEVVGFILATTIQKEGTAWKRYGYVSWIGIDDPYQRTNLGSRLYRRLEDTFRENGVRMIIADTEADNKQAVFFFESLGFTMANQHVWLAKTLKKQLRKPKTKD